MGKKNYVVGFLFNNKREVVLIRENRPDWQAGRLNGVGGHIERGETPHDAMCREFCEEAGPYSEEWEVFCLLEYLEANVYFFRLFGDYNIETQTDEAVNWYPVKDLPGEVIPNLNWLIPFALFGEEEPPYRLMAYRHL